MAPLRARCSVGMRDAPHAGVNEAHKRRDRAVVRGAFATGLARLVMAAASFVSLGIAARFLTEAEFGLVVTVISLSLVLTMFDLGVSGALTTRVARVHAFDNLPEIRGHMNHALLALTGIGGVLAVAGGTGAVVLPWHDWIGSEVAPAALVQSLIVMFAVAGMMLPAMVGVACLGGMQRYATVQLAGAAGGVAAAGASALAALTDPRPEVFVLAILGGPLVVYFSLTAWVMLAVLHGIRSPSGLALSQIKSMARASAYYAMYNAANTVSLGTSVIIVGAVSGFAEAAVLGVAVRLFSPIITVVASSGTRLWPSMTEAISRGDFGWATSRYRNGLIYVSGISAAVGITLIVVGPWLAELWVGPGLVPSRSLLAWTAAFTIAIAVTSQVGVVLTAVERLRARTVLAVVTAVIAVTTSVVLTQLIGAPGALIGATAACLGILLPGLALLARSSLRALEAPAGGVTDRSLAGH